LTAVNASGTATGRTTRYG